MHEHSTPSEPIRAGGQQPPEATPPSDSDSPAPRTRRLPVTRLVGAAALALVLGLGAAGVMALLPSPDSAAQPDAATLPEAATAQVEAGDLTSHTTARGQLQFATRTDLRATRAGVITELPAPGTVLQPGRVAYRIDTSPVVVMQGTMPAWRSFEMGMSPGVDVRQLEDNLRSFGYLNAEPSEEFNVYTRWAVRSWQHALGLTPQDSLSQELIIFADKPLTVGAGTLRVGDRVAAGDKLYPATGLTQQAVAKLKPADAEHAPVGTPVTVELPDGTSTDGTVASVGAAQQEKQAEEAAEEAGQQAGELLMPVTVAVPDQAALAQFSQVSVTLSFGSVVRENVLRVPVDALVPVDEESFAVELPRRSTAQERELVPVTVGAFASGLVEISGEGITEGLEVTVPRR